MQYNEISFEASTIRKICFCCSKYLNITGELSVFHKMVNKKIDIDTAYIGVYIEVFLHN